MNQETKHKAWHTCLAHLCKINMTEVEVKQQYHKVHMLLKAHAKPRGEIVRSQKSMCGALVLSQGRRFS